MCQIKKEVGITLYLPHTPTGYILKEIMKSGIGKNILILSIFCMIAVWLFGIFFMHKIDDHGSLGCFAAAARNIDCPQTMSTLEYIAFHANVFNVFSNSVSVDTLIALIFFSLFISLIYFTRVKSSTTIFNQFLRRGDVFHSIIPDYFLRWFSFYEKRDPLVVYYS